MNTKLSDGYYISASEILKDNIISIYNYIHEGTPLDVPLEELCYECINWLEMIKDKDLPPIDIDESW